MTEETIAEGHSDAGHFREEHYSSRDVSTGRRLNPLLVQIASGLTPGTALGLGPVLGGDTLRPAGAGRRVASVDVSGTAAAQVADAARERGLGDLVHAERTTWPSTFPKGASTW
ncbi:hypothetical protein [Streptomyces sp. NPDC088730]|uniref:hypothetical protein n=1 Tax=Streptomyces sp. NPDC088730 TaxID=3365877 RepID=UPI003804BFD5